MAQMLVNVPNSAFQQHVVTNLDTCLYFKMLAY